MKYVGLLLLVFFHLHGFSQDIIFVKGEKKVKGKIISYDRDSLLVYEDKKGNRFEVHKQEISLIRELVVRGQSLPVKKQYTLLQTGLAFGNLDGVYANPEFRLSSGRKINNYLQPGVGIGIDFYDDYNLMPIYANLYGVLSETMFTGFYNVRLGYSSALERKNAFTEFSSLKGGFSYEFEFGGRSHLRRTFITYSIGYKHQKASAEREEWWWWRQTVSENHKLRRITFRIGIGI